MGLALLAYDTSCISAVASSMTATGDHGAGSCAPNRSTDTKRSHRSARLRWVTFWVTRKVPLR
jgi:hypothetical protein